ncbi:hypothetical protein SCEN_A01000 [Saccharomyces cerevisiae]|nr:hypothetical protein SCEN_A01000 [Saccharomyces cerevisiae]
MAAIRDYKTALDFTKSLPRPDGFFLSNGHGDRVRNGHFYGSVGWYRFHSP